MTLHVNIYYCTYTYIIHKVYIIHTRTATATYLQRTIIRHQDIYRIYSWFSSPLFWMGWDCFFMFLLIFILYLFFCANTWARNTNEAPRARTRYCAFTSFVLCLPMWTELHLPQTSIYFVLFVDNFVFFLDKIQSFYLVFLMNPSLPQSPYLSP